MLSLVDMYNFNLSGLEFGLKLKLHISYIFLFNLFEEHIIFPLAWERRGSLGDLSPYNISLTTLTFL